MIPMCGVLGVCSALWLVPAGVGTGGIVLADHERTEYQIVIPWSGDTALDYAASELQRLLRDVSGAELPVVIEAEAETGPAILLGPTRKARARGLVHRARALGQDGVLLKTVGDDLIVLGGGDRGHLYAVYVLLERYLGCRFLAIDCTITPQQSRVALPEIDYSYAPPFIYREELYHDMFTWSFAARLKLNGSNISQCLGRPVSDSGEVIKGVLISPFAHSAFAMVPPSVYFDSHPEYYSLVNGERRSQSIGGQLCYTNPDVLRICTEWVLQWIAEHPEVECVDISQNDAYPGDYGACECPTCRAVVEEEGAEMGPILRVVNAIAAAVKERYPNKLVDTLAYQYTVSRPEHTVPLDNVVIRLCHHACYFHGIEGEELGTEYREAVDDWHTVAPSIWVWHYGTNFWSYLTPNPNLTAIPKDMRFYYDHGVNGVMLQGNIQSTGGELSDFRQYLTAQLLWDPTQDPMVIRSEFCEGYYGPAKGDVMEFLASMDAWAAALDQHIPMNGWDPPSITPPEWVAQGLVTLDRVFGRTTDPVIRNRIEKLMLPLWVMQLRWPDRYGLAREDGLPLIARMRSLVERNNIRSPSEWNHDMPGFLAGLEAQFAAPMEGG